MSYIYVNDNMIKNTSYFQSGMINVSNLYKLPDTYVNSMSQN